MWQIGSLFLGYRTVDGLDSASGELSGDVDRGYRCPLQINDGAVCELTSAAAEGVLMTKWFSDSTHFS